MSDTRDTVNLMADESTPISFSRGAPSLDIIDAAGLAECATKAFEQDPAGTFGYGTSVGYPPLRSWIADRYDVADNQVVITNGSMQADAFLFAALVNAGDHVIVERPTYDRTLGSLKARGAVLHAIDLEDDGINVNQLRELLESGVRPTMAHIIPNFQNPAGYSLSLEKRHELVALAQQYDFVIFEDDPYIELRFSGERHPTMLAIANEANAREHVVYASSFSKTVCPGIRVGYLVGSASFIGEIINLATASYISPNMVAQSIVNQFVRGDYYQASIETVKAALQERVEVLAQSLRTELPEASFIAPEGGYFIWLTFPEGTDGDALFQACADRNLAVVKGSDFLLDDATNSLRLAFSAVGPAQIREGVSRLAQAYYSMQG